MPRRRSKRIRRARRLSLSSEEQTVHGSSSEAESLRYSEVSITPATPVLTTATHGTSTSVTPISNALSQTNLNDDTALTSTTTNHSSAMPSNEAISNDPVLTAPVPENALTTVPPITLEHQETATEMVQMKESPQGFEARSTDDGGWNTADEVAYRPQNSFGSRGRRAPKVHAGADGFDNTGFSNTNATAWNLPDDRSANRNTWNRREYHSRPNKRSAPPRVEYPTSDYIRMLEDGTRRWITVDGRPMKSFESRNQRNQFRYIVIQRNEKQVVAIYDPPPRRTQQSTIDWSGNQRESQHDPADLPKIILVREEMILQQWQLMEPCPFPLVGDRLWVRKVSVRSGRPVQDRIMPIKNCDDNGLIQASAIGIGVTVARRFFKLKPTIAIVTAVNAERGTPRIRVTMRYFERSAVLPPYAVPEECYDLQRGDLVKVWLHVPQVGSRLSAKGHYCLPPESAYATDEEHTTTTTRFFDTITKWTSEDGLPSHRRPFNDITDAEQLEQRLKLYEDLSLAAAARAHEQKITEMKRAIYVGRMIPGDTDALQFTTPTCHSDDEFQARSQLWKEDAIVLISTVDPKTPNKAAETVGIAQLSEVGVDEEEKTFTVQLRAEPLSPSQKSIDPSSELGRIVQGELDAHISFAEDNTAFKKLADIFRQNSLTTIFKQKLPVRHALAAMLGISHLFPRDDDIKQESLLFDNADLNAEQLQSLHCPLNGEPLTFISASAGTGKTTVLGRLCREVHERRRRQLGKDTLLVTAASNNAVMNLADAFTKCTPAKANEFLVLQSNAFLRTAAGQRGATWSESRLLPTVKRLLGEHQNQMEEDEKQDLRDYITRMEDGMSFHVPDQKAISFVFRYFQPSVIFITMGMLHRCYGKLQHIVTSMAADEVAVLNDQEFITTLAMLTNATTVTFVGDPKQSKSHDFDIPDGVRDYGFFPVTDVISERNIPKIDLVLTYRFPESYLDRLVSPTCYDHLLKSGSDDSKHRMFTQLKFHGIRPSLPAIVFNTDVKDQRTLAKSRQNEVQRLAAIKMAREIRRQLPHAKIDILTYYAAESNACQQELRRQDIGDIHVSTVDKFQGRETDFALILLSRAHSDTDEYDAKNFKFVLDPNRATVAVTRNRQGLIVFGQVSLLMRNEVWNRFLTALEPHSPFVELECMDDVLGK